MTAHALKPTEALDIDILRDAREMVATSWDSCQGWIAKTAGGHAASHNGNWEAVLEKGGQPLRNADGSFVTTRWDEVIPKGTKLHLDANGVVVTAHVPIEKISLVGAILLLTESPSAGLPNAQAGRILRLLEPYWAIERDYSFGRMSFGDATYMGLSYFETYTKTIEVPREGKKRPDKVIIGTTVADVLMVLDEVIADLESQ